MALKKCKECGKEVSTKAKECPSCGAPVKMSSGSGCAVGCLAIFIGFIFLFIIGSLTDSDKPTQTTVPKTPEQTRKARIESGFSVWDGSHRELTKMIKKSMNDPDSYDHVDTVWWDKGDYLIVRTTFRGKNAFGAIVKNWIKAKTDLNGNVIVIIEQGQ